MRTPPGTDIDLPPAAASAVSSCVAYFVLVTPQACRVFIPGSEISPVAPAVEVLNLNSWTVREF